jgi:hypothetical protein
MQFWQAVRDDALTGMVLESKEPFKAEGPAIPVRITANSYSWNG